MKQKKYLDPNEDTDAPHLRIYEDRSILYGRNGSRLQVFREGNPIGEVQSRAEAVRSKFSDGFLQSVVKRCREGKVNFERLSKKQKQLLTNLEGAITSEVGRALVGLSILQMSIKAVEPNQSIRLHKAGTGFSWTEGIPMRVIDAGFVTPVLREEDLLKVNKYGVMMTRSLAENYPYTRFYKASIRGAKKDWVELVDLLENGQIDAEAALEYCIWLLIKRSKRFQSLASEVVKLAQLKATRTEKPDDVLNLMIRHISDPGMPAARLLEVIMHSLMQAIEEMGALGELELRSMSQMRQANKKAGNLADIELVRADVVVEAWDAKFGKPYLYDELLELRDKLLEDKWPMLQIAGFVTDQKPDLRGDVVAKQKEIEDEFEVKIAILSLVDWMAQQIERVPKSGIKTLAEKWLIAYAESLALFRISEAPIDEPTETWLEALKSLLS